MTRSCIACFTRLQAGEPAYKTLCRDCFVAAKRRQEQELREEVERLRSAVGRQRPAASIDPDMLRRLPQLCHPDRHGGSALATGVTAWLLSQRESVR